MRERRRFIRYEAKGEVILTVKNDASCQVNAELADISFVGIGVLAEKKIELDTQVNIKLTLESFGETITAEGRIKYAQEIKKFNANVFRIGIEFTNIDKQAIQDILNYLQANICLESRRKQ